MRLFFAGTPHTAVPALEALVASRHDVVAVVTRPDAPAGRGRTLVPSPVKVRALELGIPVLTPSKLRGDESLEFRAALADLRVDCAAVVAYGALIPADLLDVFPHGWINLHFSILPAWRGAAPVQRAILAGDEVSGASTFRIEEGLDTGPVYGLATETIRWNDTSGTLLERLASTGSELLVRTMDAIEDGTAQPIPQERQGVSTAPKILVDDARVRWDHPALAVDRLIRSCTPEPGAWTTLPDGVRMGLGPIDPKPYALPEAAQSLAPGQLLVEKKRVLVGTGSTPIALKEVSPSGKKAMAAADWARGARLAEGTRLGIEISEAHVDGAL